MKKRKSIKELEANIDALKKQWPAHSVPPAMLMQLDELEDKLEAARKETNSNTHQESDY